MEKFSEEDLNKKTIAQLKLLCRQNNLMKDCNFKGKKKADILGILRQIIKIRQEALDKLLGQLFTEIDFSEKEKKFISDYFTHIDIQKAINELYSIMKNDEENIKSRILDVVFHTKEMEKTVEKLEKKKSLS